MKIGIVGLGLIGGSIALGAKKLEYEVSGFDISDNAIQTAISNQIINSLESIESMSNTCDIIVLCTPPKETIKYLETALSGTAIVTDVSSVKKQVCEFVETLDENLRNNFIGGHPMAGSEQSGIDAARENLFYQKMWVLVPPRNSSLKNVSIIETFISALGAEHCVLSTEQHDQLVAGISHLPHLASAVLMDLAKKSSVENEIILRLAGGGFRDMTRIAASNTKMWLDIVDMNAEEIAEQLSVYISELEKLKSNIETHNADAIEKLFIRTRKARQSLPDAARRLEHLCELLVPVPDTPGVLAKIAGLTQDINIYDIKILHSLEEDRGVLSLVVSPEHSEILINKLTDNGFQVVLSQLDIGQADED
ncbi:MAG: prephenate dehydrogenase/arogenate dehydrogenase family protein [Acidimicrobiia bacterium]